MTPLHFDNFNKTNFFEKKDIWLASLFAALFLLFPTILSLSNVALALIIVTWVLTYKHNECMDIIKSNPIIWVLGSMYLMVLLGSVMATSHWEWASIHLRKYAIFLYAIVIILLLTSNLIFQKIAFNAFIAAMLFILLSTWLNIWFLLPWSKSQNLGWGNSHHVFGDYITQNIMMTFFTIVTLHKAIRATPYKYKIVWGAISGLALISITHLSLGRTGIVLLLVALITYSVVMSRGKWRVASLVGIIIIMSIAIGSSTIIDKRITRAIEEAQRHDVDNVSSIGHRLYNYKTTQELILDKPFFGHGTGGYHTEICRFINNSEPCERYSWHPHNQFLFFGADHGLVGILLYSFLILSIYYVALRSSNLDARVLLCSLTSILLFDSLINSPFYSSRESQFFLYMIALLVSMAAPQPTTLVLQEETEGYS